jgi:hypothetical protein
MSLTIIHFVIKADDQLFKYNMFPPQRFILLIID